MNSTPLTHPDDLLNENDPFVDELNEHEKNEIDQDNELPELDDSENDDIYQDNDEEE